MANYGDQAQQVQSAHWLLQLQQGIVAFRLHLKAKSREGIQT
ncbi:MAG: hypothetical protein ABJL99_08340 [Aliishimia sp.]